MQNMTPKDFFERIEPHRAELARAGVRRIGVFGSVAPISRRQEV